MDRIFSLNCAPFSVRRVHFGIQVQLYFDRAQLKLLSLLVLTAAAATVTSAAAVAALLLLLLHAALDLESSIVTIHTRLTASFQKEGPVDPYSWISRMIWN